MPRPEQTPVARYQGLPYGANAVANAGIDAAEDMDQEVDEGFDEQDEFQPADEEEAFLFSPTDRPDEPLTTGMGFGPGPNVASAVVQGESRTQFAQRIGQQMQAEGENSPGMKKFLAAAERGL